MKQVDIRFDREIVENWIGSRFDMYKCDLFDSSRRALKSIGMYLGNQVYTLNNLQENVDYYGKNENIAVLRIAESCEQDIQPIFPGIEQAEMRIQDTIRAVSMINEKQQVLSEKGEQYIVRFTRGLLFHMGKFDLLFMKDMIPFSEDILIKTGKNLLAEVPQNEVFTTGWNEERNAKVSQEIVSVRQKYCMAV